MGALDRKSMHDSGDVVDREFPSIASRILGNVARG